MKTIFNHLGLGDLFVINGMVRHFAETGKVITFCKKCHYVSAKFMYRDIADWVTVIPLETGTLDEMKQHTQGEEICLGVYSMDSETFSHLTCGPGSTVLNWASMFYIQAGLHPYTMYSKFYVLREKALEIVPPEEPYIFIHDDKERGRHIDVKTSLHIYRPQSAVKTDGTYVCDHPNIFDYIGVMEHAYERHHMNSSYQWLVEFMSIGSRLTNFFHLNVGAHDFFPNKNTKTMFRDELWTFIEH